MPVDGPQYPVLLTLAGRKCLVIGDSAVAARKADDLVAAGADVSVLAPDAYRRGDVAGYRLVLVATDDSTFNAQVYEDAEAAGVWINCSDDPAHCSFTLPAIARRGDLTVAVSTAGRSPAMARWVRDQIAEQVGPEYEVLLRLLAERREALRSNGTPTEGMNWQDALDSEMLDLVRAGRLAEARERLQACL